MMVEPGSGAFVLAVSGSGNATGGANAVEAGGASSATGGASVVEGGSGKATGGANPAGPGGEPNGPSESAGGAIQDSLGAFGGASGAAKRGDAGATGAGADSFASEPSGCGCRVGTRRPPVAWSSVLAVLGLLLWRRWISTG